MVEMRLPKKIELGQLSQSPVYSLWHRFNSQGKEQTYDNVCDEGPRLMSFVLPSFQRGVVWTDAQMVRFIESLHYGVYPGTYTYNSTYHLKENRFVGADGKTYYRRGNWLLDGQQRLTSLHRYFTNEWPVFNLFWADLDRQEQMGFLMNAIFPEYETKFDDEFRCRQLYDLMAFGGVPHQEHERALPLNGQEK